MPLSVAIIGAGPAGFYTAEALLESGLDIRIDIIERLATPFGLIRAGVAPDHQSTKQVVRRFEATALHDLVHFYGNIEVGADIALDECRLFYDAVVLAVGAGRDRPLGIPGEQLEGVYGSALFVGWYNGHPDFADLDPELNSRAIVIGNGNVALDVARVLVKSSEEMAVSDLPEFAAAAIRRAGIEDVYIVGRRTAAEARFTLAELREIGALADCEPVIDPQDVALPALLVAAREQRQSERNLAVLRGFAARATGLKPKRLHLRFNLAPVEIEGDHSVSAVRFEHTRADAGRLVGTGRLERIACGLVVAAVGYRASPLIGVPFDAERGLFLSDDGRVADGLYVVGWAKRGPSGVIGSNRPDGLLCARQIMADVAAGPADPPKSGRAGLERCLQRRHVRAITFDDWRKIDRAEIAAAAAPAPRRKLTSLGEMLSLLADGSQRAIAQTQVDVRPPVTERAPQ